MDYEYTFDAAVDYEYDQVNGMDLRDRNGPSFLEVSASFGPWAGVEWDIDFDSNYWIALRLLQRQLHGCNEDNIFREVPDAHLCICLMTDAPYPGLLERAKTDLVRVQKGLQQAAYEQLRFPSQNRKKDKIRKRVVFKFGVSDAGAKDFFLAWTHFACCMGRYDATSLASNLLKPFVKVVKTSEQLFAALGGLAMKHKDGGAQVAVVKGVLTGQFQPDSASSPDVGHVVIVIDSPSCATVRIGFRSNKILTIPRNCVSINRVSLVYNVDQQHVRCSAPRSELQDGIVLAALQEVAAAACSKLCLPDSYNGWAQTDIEYENSIV